MLGFSSSGFTLKDRSPSSHSFDIRPYSIMRLIRCDTLKLEEFYGYDIPPYAILSHTWGNNEVTFSDINAGEQPGSLLDWAKINQTCRLAMEQRYEYVWVDTCCIDKSSSTELTEAINSMFAWYECSEVCFAYLDDYDSSTETVQAALPREREHPSLTKLLTKRIDLNDLPMLEKCLDYVTRLKSTTTRLEGDLLFNSVFGEASTNSEEIDTSDSSSLPLTRSRWFSRGWTLQELIASRNLVFYDSKWKYHSSKKSLAVDIAAATGIDAIVLEAEGSDLRERLDSIPVCRKMAWAAKRETKRLEDRAYSLLGIFGVHMPLTYGEGANAFQRLQKEIIQVTNDLTILAWEHPYWKSETSNILAESPSMFGKTNDIELSQDLASNPHFVITNKGLQVSIPISTYPGRTRIYSTESSLWTMSLYCHRRDSPCDSLGILLKGITGTVFHRVESDRLLRVPNKISESLIFLTTDIHPKPRLQRPYGYRIYLSRLSSEGFIRLLSYHPETHWGGGLDSEIPINEPQLERLSKISIFEARGATRFLGFSIYQAFHGNRGQKFVVVCGFDSGVAPWVSVGTKGSQLWYAAKGLDYEQAQRLASASMAQKAMIDLRKHYPNDLAVHIYVTLKDFTKSEDHGKKVVRFQIRAVKFQHAENETCARCKSHSLGNPEILEPDKEFCPKGEPSSRLATRHKYIRTDIHGHELENI
ncbi:heterokaryon incompatibility protein-domain-containing protein [Xylariaceae sp. FL1019]|nr:heterokaryon incompatibility protein-domain-containing protein [Xylariaceae sp. FL1019]